ncbi:hypothetical protein L596_014328 [Steinernema carpocapsae]|uniref:RYYR-CCHC domain-containing protein n=1 Tax=Steinernema carpocapsae TaxID=34508 RepID=A0A4U5NCE9_STECR|nr:hypothetical protein L596_014328 [Steinernema carpocapsae]
MDVLGIRDSPGKALVTLITFIDVMAEILCQEAPEEPNIVPENEEPQKGAERRLRINWNHPDLQRLLYQVRQEGMDPKAAASELEQITGASVTPTTIKRQAQKLVVHEVKYDEPSFSREGSPQEDDDYDNLEPQEISFPRYEWSLTQRGTRGLMVFESEEWVRLYRLGGKTADGGNTAIYFRCSQCDRLKFKGSTPIKFVFGQPANSLTPKHHEKCLPRDAKDVMKQQLDRRARNLVKTGVAPKRAFDIVRRGAAEDEEMMPDFKRVSKSYYRVRRKSAAANQAARKDEESSDDDDEHVVVD